MNSFWIMFLSAAILLNISPGPDMLYLISQTMSSGRKAGFASVLGLGSGALVHTLFVSLGISAIIAASITVFRIMKIIGAAYLFYLGTRALIFGEIDLTNLDKKKEKLYPLIPECGYHRFNQPKGGYILYGLSTPILSR